MKNQIFNFELHSFVSTLVRMFLPSLPMSRNTAPLSRNPLPADSANGAAQRIAAHGPSSRRGSPGYRISREGFMIQFSRARKHVGNELSRLFFFIERCVGYYIQVKISEFSSGPLKKLRQRNLGTLLLNNQSTLSVQLYSHRNSQECRPHMRTRSLPTRWPSG